MSAHHAKRSKQTQRNERAPAGDRGSPLVVVAAHLQVYYVCMYVLGQLGAKERLRIVVPVDLLPKLIEMLIWWRVFVVCVFIVISEQRRTRARVDAVTHIILPGGVLYRFSVAECNECYKPLRALPNYHSPTCHIYHTAYSDVSVETNGLYIHYWSLC